MQGFALLEKMRLKGSIGFFGEENLEVKYQNTTILMIPVMVQIHLVVAIAVAIPIT